MSRPKTVYGTRYEGHEPDVWDVAPLRTWVLFACFLGGMWFLGANGASWQTIVFLTLAVGWWYNRRQRSRR